MGFDGNISGPDGGPVDEVTGITVDRFGRYRLPLPPVDRGAPVTPAGGPLRSYSRATTIASSMEYRGSLEAWALRETVRGVGLRPDLALKARGSGGDRRALDEVVTEAQAVSGMHAGRNQGTGLHGVSIEIDKLLAEVGDQPIEAWPAVEGIADSVPAEYRGDVLAYAQLVAEGRIRPPAGGGDGNELVVVHPDLMVAGRFDKVRQVGGEDVIVDVKTQKDEPGKYGQLPIAMQLAIYAHAPWIYDDADPTAPCWRPMYRVSKKVAYVIWVPSGAGRAKLIRLDIAAAWLWVETAMKVRESRNVKGLYFPVAEVVTSNSWAGIDTAPPSTPAAPAAPAADAVPPPGPDGIIPAVRVARPAEPKGGGRRCGKCGGTGHNARTCTAASTAVSAVSAPQKHCSHTSGWGQDEEGVWRCADCNAPGADPRTATSKEAIGDLTAPRQPPTGPGPDGAVQALREATPAVPTGSVPPPAPPWSQPAPEPEPASASDGIPPELIPPGIGDRQLPVLKEILQAETTDDLTKIYDRAMRAGLWDGILMGPAQSRYLELAS